VTLSSIFLLSTIFINGLLGGIVLTHTKKDRESFFFFLIILSLFFWATPLFFYEYTDNFDLALNLSKVSYFAVILTSISLLSFAISFTYKNKKVLILSDTLNFLSLIFFAISLYKNWIISSFSIFEKNARVILFGPLYSIYSLFVSLFLLLGVVFLFWKLFKEKNIEKKKQTQYILVGILFPIIGGTVTNLILPTLGNFSLYWLGPVFTLIMIYFISIAILRHHLFNIRIIATESFIFALWGFLLIRLIISTELQDRLINGGLLIATIIIGIFLIRSVLREVQQREYIEKLAGDLAKANDRLLAANEKLKELDKQKTEFVSIASHQLRSPLTAIKGYSSMLLEGSFGKLTGKTKDAVDVIYQSSQHLVSVIEDFLNITRIELGRMKYEFGDQDMKKMVETVMKEQEPNVKRKGIAMTLEADAGPHIVNVDIGKISQVISNLIDNSIKYTPKGSVALSVKRVPDPAGDRVRFMVKDTGVGIDAATLPKLFEKFVRAYDAGQTNIVGTGLGLYVAKQIVEGHPGGKLWAESEGKGKGSSFFLEFPDPHFAEAKAKKEEVSQFAQAI